MVEWKVRVSTPCYLILGVASTAVLALANEAMLDRLELEKLSKKL